MRTRFWLAGGVAILISALGASAQQSQPSQDQPAQSSQPAASQQPPDQKSQTGAAPQQQETSLADAARKSRADKKTESKPAKVFTNDNLPAAGGVNVVGDENAEPAASAEADAGANSGNDEKAWRDRFASARAKLQRDQADLDVMQRELGKLEVQYYPDPVKQMQQSVTNSDIIDKRNKIEQKKAGVAADQQAISDLEDQLHKSGGDSGWAR